MRILTGWWIVAALTVVGCGPAPDAGPNPGAEAIRVRGPASLTSALVPALVDSYRRARPDVTFDVATVPVDDAIRALLDDEADLVPTARAARPNEEEQAKARRFSLRSPDAEHVLAVDVVAVAVHPKNPIESLTYDQVIGVFCTREITDWSALGRTPGPIHPIVPDLGSGDRLLFEDFFCGPKGIHPKVTVGTGEQLQTALDADPDAVTFVSSSVRPGKRLALTPDPSVPPVRPTQDDIIRGSYPLYGDVFLLTRGPATGELRAFLDWIESPAGQEIVDEQHYVPLFLRPERLDEPRPLRETLHFEPGSSTPDARSLARIGLLVDEVRERKVQHVILEGYADDREPDAFKLSEQRASAVRELLAARVPELYFEIIPRGPKSPIAPNDTPFGRQVNRRVQVYLAEDEHPSAAEVSADPTPSPEPR
ncbi:MAG: phosphate ABC transporter substrate-binding/OmpA family protein [Myxococcota bacterium]